MLSCLVPTLPRVFSAILLNIVASVSSPTILLIIYVNNVAAPALFDRVVLQGHSFAVQPTFWLGLFIFWERETKQVTYLITTAFVCRKQYIMAC